MRRFPANRSATAGLIVLALVAAPLAGCTSWRGEWSCPAFIQN